MNRSGSSASARTMPEGDGSANATTTTGAGAIPGPGSGAPPPNDIPDGSDDDIVARQLREAAENETDPELREKLWDEYRKYKTGEDGAESESESAESDSSNED